MYRFLLILLLGMFLFGCANTKTTTPLITDPVKGIPELNDIQPDTCFTDRQLRDYYKFVKDMTKLENKRESDSLKIELKKQKQRDKNEIDSLRIELKKHKSDNTVIKYEIRFDAKKFNDSISAIRKMYGDSLKYEREKIKEENKTERTEIRQENRTERARLNRWLIFFIGLGTGISLVFILKLVNYPPTP